MTIAKRIGHSDIKYVMETYGHLYPQVQSEVVRRLEEVEAGNELATVTTEPK